MVKMGVGIPKSDDFSLLFEMMIITFIWAISRFPVNPID
jgi:hypothetical protein